MNLFFLIKKSINAFILFLVIIFSFGCGGAKPNSSLATINTSSISNRHLSERLIRNGILRIKHNHDREKLIDVTLENLIREELIAIAANRAGIAVEKAEVDRAIRNSYSEYLSNFFYRILQGEFITPSLYKKLTHRSILIECYLNARAAGRTEVTDREIEEYYSLNLDEFKAKGSARIRHILAETKEEAEFVLDKIKKRKISFTQAARKYSVSPEFSNGGDLGWFSAEELPVEFGICFTLNKFAVSNVVASRYGFHIFQVIDRKPERLLKIDEAREHIFNKLKIEKERVFLKNVDLELKKRFLVKINTDNLKNIKKKFFKTSVDDNI